MGGERLPRNRDAEIEIAWDSVYCSRTYHGYRLLDGRRNPSFNKATDGRLLNFKDGDAAAIAADAAEMSRVVAALRLASAALLTMVPGHRATSTNRGTPMARLIEIVAALNPLVVAAIDLLVRYRDVGKLADGGDRSVGVHVESMRVSGSPAVEGLTVIVLDDIVSSGHSMTAARKVLTRSGAALVACVAIAQTWRVSV